MNEKDFIENLQKRFGGEIINVTPSDEEIQFLKERDELRKKSSMEF